MTYEEAQKKLAREAQKKLARIQKLYKNGVISEYERDLLLVELHNEVIEILRKWAEG